jgi:hypothetical protein
MRLTYNGRVREFIHTETSRIASSRVESRRVEYSLDAAIFNFASRTPVTGVTAAIFRSEMNVE